MTNFSINRETGEIRKERIEQIKILAKYYYDKGLIPIPIIGKAPVGDAWQKTQHDSNTLLKFNQDLHYKKGNIGLVTGELGGIWVLDWDNKPGAEASLAIITHGIGTIDTLTTLSGNKGLHFYFKWEERLSKLGQNQGKWASVGLPFVDVRSNGGQIVAPGSLHPETFECYSIYHEAPINPMPDILYDRLMEYEAKINPKVSNPLPMPTIHIDSLPIGQLVSEDEFVYTEVSIPRDIILQLFSEAFIKIIPDDMFGLGKIQRYRYPGQDMDSLRLLVKRKREGVCVLGGHYPLNPTKIATHKTQNISMNPWANGTITCKCFGSHQEQMKDVIIVDKREKKELLHLIGAPEIRVIPSIDPWEEKKMLEGDNGQADILLKHLNDTVVYTDIKHGVCYIFNQNNTLWEKRSIEVVENMVPSILIPIVEKMIEKAKVTNANKATIRTLGILKSHCESSGHARAVMRFAKGTTYRADDVFRSQLDQQHHLFPVRNNLVINLRTGEARSRTKEDMFTIQAPVTYDSNVRSIKVDKFLLDIMLDDPDKVRFLQRVLGYCLTGDIAQQKIFYFWGPEGGNGKSTLMAMMEAIMGRFALSASKEVFIAVKSASAGAPSPQVAELKGPRLVSFAEIKEESIINEEMVLKFTGGDTMNGRFLNENPMQFVPRAKGVMIINPKPKCSNSPALWRRQMLVPFLAEFKEAKDFDEKNPKHRQRINGLDGELKTDETCKTAFLNWLIEGAVTSWERQWIIPDWVLGPTEEYKREMDSSEEIC